MWVLTLVLAITVPILYFGAELPPPKVGLRASPKWIASGTNAIVYLALTNSGHVSATFSEEDSQAIIETPTGWLTNRTPYASSGHGVFIAADEQTTFSVAVPTNSIRWQVRVRYRYFRRHGSHYEVWSAIDRTGFGERAPRWLHDVAWKGLNGLVRYTTADGTAEVSTEFFTNLPPVQVTAPE